MEQQTRVSLLGSNLDSLSFQETISKIEAMIEQGGPAQHVSINAGKINLMRNDPSLRSIVNRAALITADGQSIVWAAKYLGCPVPERVTGIDLFRELVKLAAEKGWRPYYLGATAEVVEAVVKHDQQLYPDLNIAGFHHGYFSEDESLYVAKEIARTKQRIGRQKALLASCHSNQSGSSCKTLLGCRQSLIWLPCGMRWSL